MNTDEEAQRKAQLADDLVRDFEAWDNLDGAEAGGFIRRMWKFVDEMTLGPKQSREDAHWCGLPDAPCDHPSHALRRDDGK